MFQNKKNPIVILGANGQVGQELVKICAATSQPYKAFGHAEADFLDPDIVIQHLQDAEPSAVINAAAYNAVDLAESNSVLAHQVNGITPGLLAKWCAKAQVPFVHYSSDYIFSGHGSRPWLESDQPRPLNVYGNSKLAGENSIQSYGQKYLILRTSWVYSPQGKNFLNTILRLAHEREEISIVNDQIGAPTLALHLAQATLKMLSRPEFHSGIYNVTNSGETSWYDFARAIVACAREKKMNLKLKKVLPIPSAEYSSPAQRPLNSRLDGEKLRRVFNLQLDNWKSGLQLCMEMKNENNRDAA